MNNKAVGFQGNGKADIEQLKSNLRGESLTKYEDFRPFENDKEMDMTLVTFCLDQAPQETSEELEAARRLWAIDSDDDEEELNPAGGTNPFIGGAPTNIEQKPTEVNEHGEELSAECKMNNFILRIQSRAAIPKFALSDAVFLVDKPKEAVPLDTKLPIKSLSKTYTVGAVFTLEVSEVYSPFQFWFHVINGANCLLLLEKMHQQINDYYYAMVGSKWQLATFFMQPGYLCAVFHEYNWRRGHIVSKPAASDGLVSIFLVDYGKRVEVRRTDIKFLHRRFADRPAFAMRGTLTDVYPLDLHWPVEATDRFKCLVDKHELHATIKDVDAGERVLFVSLSSAWQRKGFETSISDQLIANGLAGRSKNYTEELRAANCGRRLRYLREALPTFDMLETQLFPTEEEDFESKFDDIIYMPQFFQNFQPPKLGNPFRRDLQVALASWLRKFQPEEMRWRELKEEKHKKLKQQHEENLKLFYRQNPHLLK